MHCQKNTEIEELGSQMSFHVSREELDAVFNPVHVDLETYTSMLLSITEPKVTFKKMTLQERFQ